MTDCQSRTSATKHQRPNEPLSYDKRLSPTEKTEIFEKLTPQSLPCISKIDFGIIAMFFEKVQQVRAREQGDWFAG